MYSHKGPAGRNSTEVRYEPAQLLALIADKDRLALRRLYDLFGGKLYARLYLATGQVEISDDLLVEVFVRIWQTAYQFDARNRTPIQWLFTTTHGLLRERKLVSKAYLAAILERLSTPAGEVKASASMLAPLVACTESDVGNDLHFEPNGDVNIATAATLCGCV